MLHYIDKWVVRVIVGAVCIFCTCFTLNAEALPFLQSSSRIEVVFTSSEQENLLQEQVQEAIESAWQEQTSSEQEISLQTKVQLGYGIIEKVLRSEGFYQGEIQHKLEDEVVQYSVSAGPRYTIDEITIDTSLPIADEVEKKYIQPGDPLTSKAVLAAIDAIKAYLEEQYCLWNIHIDYDVRVFHENHSARIKLVIADSPEVVFGQVVFEGLQTIKPEYLHKKIPFQPGACFNRKLLDKTQLALLQTQLLAQVGVKLSRRDDTVDVTFIMTERKHRTVKGGLGYHSDEGLFVSAGWEHRNVLGAAQKLSTEARLSEWYRKVNTNFTVPAFLHDKQSLNLIGEVAEENLEAFNSTHILASAVIERQINHAFTGSIGVRVKFSELDDDGDKETYGLVSFPVALTYDTRNDLFDPKEGWFASASVSPFIDSLGVTTSFFKTTLAGGGYLTLKDSLWQPTFAFRAKTGSITGQNRDDIPGDERFYAGGGGSVRGYAFQTLGDLKDGDPVGGRSLLEFSTEARLHFTESWGGVLFVDGGNVYETIIPNISEELQFGYGAGVRYYTGFGPIRFDVAFPVQRRSEIDDAFQFYISIGQAF